MYAVRVGVVLLKVTDATFSQYNLTSKQCLVIRPNFLKIKLTDTIF